MVTAIQSDLYPAANIRNDVLRLPGTMNTTPLLDVIRVQHHPRTQMTVDLCEEISDEIYAKMNVLQLQIGELSARIYTLINPDMMMDILQLDHVPIVRVILVTPGLVIDSMSP